MIGLELGTELFARQGYFVYVTFTPKKAGDICRDAQLEGVDLGIPLRILRAATKEELAMQRKLQIILAAEDSTNLPWHPGRFRYITEAAD